MGVPDEFMAKLGAGVGFVLGVLAVIAGAPWWFLPLCVAFNIVLAVCA